MRHLLAAALSLALVTPTIVQVPAVRTERRGRPAEPRPDVQTQADPRRFARMNVKALTPAQLFDSPRSRRLQRFLSEVL